MESSDCWQTIGTFGDRTCPRLDSEVHCRNCEIFRAGGRALLDRPLPEGYRAELTARLAVTPEEETEQPLSLVVFRVSGAWFAMDSRCFVRSFPVTAPVPLPGRSNSIFRGMVNRQGELGLCVSLEGLLEFDREQPVIDVSARVFPRMLEIVLAGDSWIFEADEVVGGIRLDPRQREPVPPNLIQAQQGLVTGLIDWQGLRLSLLDPEILAARLRGGLG
jgi:chemotaxis-related protein WspD